jgi:hypothetical protein
MKHRNGWQFKVLVAVAAFAFTFGLDVLSVFGSSSQGWNGTTAITTTTTLTAEQSGTVITNRGDADGVALTLPAAAANLHYIVLLQAATTVSVASPDANTLICYNDVTASSISAPTIGAMIFIWCDGTSWWAIGTTIGVTYTVS